MIAHDRVRETSTTTGTGNLTLAGAVTGYQAFSSRYTGSPSDRFFYAIVGGSEWEVGEGWLSSGALVRNRVLESSNSDAAVNLSAGTKDVFLTDPAHMHNAAYGLQIAMSRCAYPII